MSETATIAPTPEAVRVALRAVNDPEIQRPITELGMVGRIDLDACGRVTVEILLTVASCPLREKITEDVRAAVLTVAGTTAAEVEFGVMTDPQRAALREKVHGANPVIPFAQPGCLTRVYCVVSGKGGVGKSSITVNTAAALVARGLRVGILDADIHGHSIPAMLGIEEKPILVDRMILPPSGYGIKVISIGMFVDGNEPVVWRGPMLHRALRQFLTDVHWGDLDLLLVDLPPGTGDIAISLAQLLPAAELLVVTTPQRTAARIAERAGAVAAQTGQGVVGVVENMSWFDSPDGTRHTPFGAGGGEQVAARLTDLVGGNCPLLGRIPFDPAVCATGDQGVPIVDAAPNSPVTAAYRELAAGLAVRPRHLAGTRLAIS